MSNRMWKAAVATTAVAAVALTGCAGDMEGGGTGEVEYPTRAIDLILPFGAGGSTDIAARAFSEALAEQLGQPINAANQTGAQQVPAVGQVLSASPDGYTLLADGAGSSSLQSLLEDIPFQWDDRTFIANVASGVHAYAVGASSGITTLDELAAQAQDDPSSFRVAWLGGTTTSDYATLQLLDALDIDPSEVTRVPFDGSGKAMQAAAAGDVDLAAGGSSAIASLYSSGDLVPLALTGEDPNFPEIPLTADQGYDNLTMKYWVGISGPADLPDSVIDSLITALEELVAAGTLNETLANLGMTVDLVTGEELEANVLAEAEEFRQLSELVE